MESRQAEEALVAAATSVLEFVDLIHLRDEYPSNLSGSQKKLLELARVLLCDPKMILLDEPAAGIGRTLMRRLTNSIARLREELSITFLIIEHDIDLVSSLCDTLIVMSEGSKLAERPAGRHPPRRAGPRRLPRRSNTDDLVGNQAQAPDGPRPVVLEAREVVTGYSELNILHGVTAYVRRGEMVAIIGPNGAGKSTLLRAMFGLLPARAEDVYMKGERVTSHPPNKLVEAGLSYVPQVDNIFPSLTILENLQMGAFVTRDGGEARMERIFDLFPDLPAASAKWPVSCPAVSGGCYPRRSPHARPGHPATRRAIRQALAEDGRPYLRPSTLSTRLALRSCSSSRTLARRFLYATAAMSSRWA